MFIGHSGFEWIFSGLIVFVGLMVMLIKISRSRYLRLDIRLQAPRNVNIRNYVGHICGFAFRLGWNADSRTDQEMIHSPEHVLKLLISLTSHLKDSS
jgi:hypothetical protein